MLDEEWEDEIDLETSIHLLPGNAIIIDTSGFLDEFNALAVRYDVGQELWYLDRATKSWNIIPTTEGEITNGTSRH